MQKVIHMVLTYDSVDKNRVAAENKTILMVLISHNVDRKNY